MLFCDIVQSEGLICVSGVVKYKVSVQGAATATLKVSLIDKDGRSVASSSEPSGVLKVVDVKLWWPYLMHENPGYLYSMEVRPHVCTHVKVTFCAHFRCSRQEFCHCMCERNKTVVLMFY